MDAFDFCELHTKLYFLHAHKHKHKHTHANL